jgi:hypothetical protein
MRETWNMFRLPPRDSLKATLGFILGFLWFKGQRLPYMQSLTNCWKASGSLEKLSLRSSNNFEKSISLCISMCMCMCKGLKARYAKGGSLTTVTTVTKVFWWKKLLGH